MNGLNHAKHNEKLCRRLYSENIFFDWIITIAFYSALHYSEYQLFPFNLGHHIFQNFDKYYVVFRAAHDNKHDARRRLITSNISPVAGAAYSWLKDHCLKSRYYDYQVNESDALTAVNKLDLFKSYLTKPLWASDGISYNEA